MGREPRVIDFNDVTFEYGNAYIKGDLYGTEEEFYNDRDELKFILKQEMPTTPQEKVFPNGFKNWVETHHEMVSFITLQLHNDPDSDDVISERYEQQGIGGMYELAEEWTDAFEEKYKGKEWDGEYFDTISEFCEEQINSK